MNLFDSPKDNEKRKLKLISKIKTQIDRAFKNGARSIAIELTQSELETVTENGVDAEAHGKLMKSWNFGVEPEGLPLAPFLQAAVHAKKLGMKITPIDSAQNKTVAIRILGQAHPELLRALAGFPDAKKNLEQIKNAVVKIRKKVDPLFLKRIQNADSDIILYGSSHQDTLKSDLKNYKHIKIELW